MAQAILALAALTAAPLAFGQATASISGKVELRETGGPLPGASVVLLELGRSVLSAEDGSFSFERVPPGSYHVVAHLESLFTDAAQAVSVEPGDNAQLDFRLSIRADDYEITVTASEIHTDTFEALSSVDSYDSLELNRKQDVNLGEALGQTVGTGVAKRGFGPGAARPIIRGFDGDRVLVMEDGLRSGTVGSQSADHGEVVNLAQLERLEIVKGPATLLHSGNAVGGVLNAISRHHGHDRRAHQGLRGFLSGSGGTANSFGSAGAGFEYGLQNWMLWGAAGSSRASDYQSPAGQVFNSRTNAQNGTGGFGWFGNNAYFSANVKVNAGTYGVPFAAEFHSHGHGHGEDHHDEHGAEEHGEHEGEHEGEHAGEHDEHEGEHDEHEGGHDEHAGEIERVELDADRYNYRVDWGLRNLGGPIESAAVKLNYVRWRHGEVEHFEDGGQILATRYRNDQFVYRAVAEQRQRGAWGGRFGVWGIDRDFEAAGEEALSPPVEQNGFAVFALEEFDFERVKFQFGARLESQRYTPAFAERHAGEHGHADHGEDDHDDHEGEEAEEGEHHDEHEEAIPDAVNRAFTGFSAATGMHADLWRGGAFVANFTRSYRAPAIEELYNYGPHAGTRAFDIGNPRLDAEAGNGIDFSLRHRQNRVRGEANFFYYDFANFIFPFAPGETRDGLQVLEYMQLDARYVGAEALADIQVHSTLALNLGVDFVDARATSTNTPLPRIPPLRGKLGFDWRAAGFSVQPELILAGAQNDTFTGETRTAGYNVVNLNASYTLARMHSVHQFAATVFNVGDRLYRNHSSYIKDLAPELGRGVRVSYTVRFF